MARRQQFPARYRDPNDFLNWRVNVSSREALLMLFLCPIWRIDAPTRVRRFAS
jgi:hypothetical protein